MNYNHLPEAYSKEKKISNVLDITKTPLWLSIDCEIWWKVWKYQTALPLSIIKIT